MQNIYKNARESAGLTQERAAEALGISVESVRVYETDRRVPPNYVVGRMCDVYGLQFLAVQHLRQTDILAREWLPDARQRPLEQSSIRLYRLIRNFANNHRTDDLIDIAEDGIISDEERPQFDAIMAELESIVATVYELRLDGF